MYLIDNLFKLIIFLYLSFCSVRGWCESSRAALADCHECLVRVNVSVADFFPIFPFSPHPLPFFWQQAGLVFEQPLGLADCHERLVSKGQVRQVDSSLALLDPQEWWYQLHDLKVCVCVCVCMTVTRARAHTHTHAHTHTQTHTHTHEQRESETEREGNEHMRVWTSAQSTRT